MFKHVFICVMLLTAFFAPKTIQATSSNSEQPVVWGDNSSPFVRKVLLALEFKELSYENKQILPSKVLAMLKQEPPVEFTKVSPLGKIPAYQEGDFSVADSSAILAYLEKAYPEKPIYPESPKTFAQALWIEEYADNVFTDVIHKKIYFELVNKPKLNVPPNMTIVEQALEKELPPILDYLEAQLQGPYAGAYFVGDTVTVADIAVVTHFINFSNNV